MYNKLNVTTSITDLGRQSTKELMSQCTVNNGDMALLLLGISCTYQLSKAQGPESVKNSHAMLQLLAFSARCLYVSL